MTDKVIRVCMATQTRVENADEAIRVVIARTLKVSKPDVSIAKGMKHCAKVVAVQIGRNIIPTEEIKRAKGLL